MADFGAKTVNNARTKIRNVPIAVTPEGFWCCPSYVALQKADLSKRKGTHPSPKEASMKRSNRCAQPKSPSVIRSRRTASGELRPIFAEFGDAETRDCEVLLSGEQGFRAKLAVHAEVLAGKSTFFRDRITQSSMTIPPCSLDIGGCEDVELYVEVVGLMYCDDIKQRLIKQSISRVLQLLKVSEILGFHAGVQSCLAFLEAVPWIGEGEEEKVMTSIQGLGVDIPGVTPLLKRVSAEIKTEPSTILANILELIVEGNEEKGRREMKSLILKLLKVDQFPSNASADICNISLLGSCRSCVNALLSLFRQEAETSIPEMGSNRREESAAKQIALQADNLLWLVEILIDRRAADEFVQVWSCQNELVVLHPKVPVASRHRVSCITSRLFIAIGRGEVLPSMDTRDLLLGRWLQPLIDDYCWLRYACRSFDGKLVEEGISLTILTLPLENQQRVLLSWLGSFLKIGDNCPNLQQAFEIWWKRAFVKPCLEEQTAFTLMH